MSGNVTVAPPSVSTMAQTASPKRALGMPTATASRIAGCVRNAISTSSGKTFSPPVLIHSDRRPFAGHAPAPPLERAERCRSLGLVLVVAERDDSADRHEPFLTGTWLHPAAVFGENASARADDEPRRLLSALGAGHRAAETDRLRRTIGVEHQRLRDVPQDAVLALLAPHGAGGHDQRETG